VFAQLEELAARRGVTRHALTCEALEEFVLAHADELEDSRGL
jgi:predicted transcriptional regulator